ncbi:alpha/beta-hydrolase, partial [Decorospora gaudefroyi]
WPQDTQSCRLPSGARLSYARLGRSKEAGQVWVLFHGTPGSRLDYTLEHEYAEKHSIRIISIDRPGYGYSSLHDRGMLGFMQDVEHVLDYCGVQEFAVLGVSGGGPYTLAAAYHFPKSRLRKAAIVCGTPHPQFQKSSVSIQGRIYRWFHGWAPWI